MAYDDTVRDSRGDIIQFRYGSDGLDPLEMETDTFPVNFIKEMEHIRVIFHVYLIIVISLLRLVMIALMKLECLLKS